MKGHLRRRGEWSWELKFDVGTDALSNRRISYVSFKGTKREAQTKLAELLATVGKGEYVEPSKTTVADFVRARVDQWEAAGDISARTAQRYRQLVENQIVPSLGAKAVQKLRPLDIEEWHTTLRNGGRVRGKGGVAARTIGHAHRILGKALRDAGRNGLVTRNVVSEQSAPKIAADEMVIVQELPALVDKLTGFRLRVPAMVALFTGMRLSEVLALRWGRVDLATKVIQVREALEQTKAFGIRAKLRNPGRGGAISPCPTSWWMSSTSTARPRSNCGCKSASGDCPTMRLCLQTSMASRFRRMRSRQHGPTLPRASTCRRSHSTL
jgi:Phage integrase, N-terminal SAM-like domain